MVCDNVRKVENVTKLGTSTVRSACLVQQTAHEVQEETREEAYEGGEMIVG